MRGGRDAQRAVGSRFILPRYDSGGLFYAQMAIEPDPPSRRRIELPEVLDAVIVKALAKRPTDRFQDMHALGAALAGIRDALGPSRGVLDLLRASGLRTTPTPALKPTVVASV